MYMKHGIICLNKSNKIVYEEHLGWNLIIFKNSVNFQTWLIDCYLTSNWQYFGNIHDGNGCDVGYDLRIQRDVLVVLISSCL